MHFQVEHHFRAAPQQVAAVLARPDFYTHLDLPDLARPTVLEHREGEGEVDGGTVIRLRYEFVGSLNSLVRRMLGGERLAWLQEIRIAGTEGSLTFGAEKNPALLYGSALFVLQQASPGSVRHLEGELVVAVPGIGAMAERRIVEGLLRRLDLEAEALDQQP